jgi:hypothetical protein
MLRMNGFDRALTEITIDGNNSIFYRKVAARCLIANFETPMFEAARKC